jgi:hypothetical protein
MHHYHCFQALSEDLFVLSNPKTAGGLAIAACDIGIARTSSLVVNTTALLPEE